MKLYEIVFSATGRTQKVVDIKEQLETNLGGYKKNTLYI